MLISTYLSTLVLHYLDSKPPLLQSVMDSVNKATFRYLIMVNFNLAVLTTCKALTSNAGTDLATILAWGHFLMGFGFGLQWSINVVLQVALVKNPALLEEIKFEKFLCNLVSFGVPVISIGVTAVIFLVGSKPGYFYVLTGLWWRDVFKNDPLSTILYFALNFASVLGLLISRLWMYLKGMFREEQSNHIIGNAATTYLFCAFLTIATVGVPLYTNLETPYKDLIIASPSQMFLQFIIIIVLSHQGVRGYISNRFPFSLISRRSRKIGSFENII